MIFERKYSRFLLQKKAKGCVCFISDFAKASYAGDAGGSRNDAQLNSVTAIKSYMPCLDQMNMFVN